MKKIILLSAFTILFSACSSLPFLRSGSAPTPLVESLPDIEVALMSTVQDSINPDELRMKQSFTGPSTPVEKQKTKQGADVIELSSVSLAIKNNTGATLTDVKVSIKKNPQLFFFSSAQQMQLDKSLSTPTLSVYNHQSIAPGGSGGNIIPIYSFTKGEFTLSAEVTAAGGYRTASKPLRVIVE